MIKEKVEKNQNYIIVFCVTILLKLLFLMIHASYGFNSDRIGDLIAPTTLAGLDWSNLIPHVNYYGYGFKWVYFIFFRITDDPTIIYYSIMIMYDILFALIGVLVYHILTRYLKMENLRLAGLIAVFMGIVQPADMKSEPSLYIAGWIVCFLLVKAINKKTKKGKILYAIWIALFLSYTMTLHERMLAIVLAFLIIFIVYRLKFKSWIVNPVVYYPLQIISYFIVEHVNDLYRLYFWGTATVTNSSALPTTINTDYLTSFYGIKVAVACIWSNLVTLGTQTYGLGWIAVAVFIGSFFFVRQRKAKNTIVKKQKTGDLIDVAENQKIYVTVDKTIYAIIWIFGTCVAIVMVGLAVRWGVNVFKGNLYGYKGFVYGRYYVNFAYPAIMAAIAYLVSHKIKRREILLTGFGIITLVIVFLKWIYPLLESAYYSYIPTETTSSTMLDWLLFATLFKSEDIGFNLYVNLLIIAGLLLLISMATLRKKNKNNYQQVLLTIIFLVVFVGTNGFSFARPSVSLSGGIYDESYNFMKTIEAHGIDLNEYIIYTDYSPWTLQYMLNRYKISHDWPIVLEEDDTEVENLLLITCFAPEQEMANFNNDVVYYVSLLDKEFIYFTDENLAEQLKNLDYEVVQLINSSESEGNGVDCFEEIENSDDSTFNITEKTISVSGIEKEYKIAVVNDLHIIAPNAEVSDEYTDLVMERYETMMVDANGIPSSENWYEMAGEINKLDADLVIFAGDMVDYASTTNIECLQHGMNVIDAPILYIRSDHDYSRHYTGDSLSEDEVATLQSTIDGDPGIWEVDMGEFVVVGINKSWKSISDEALNQVENILNQEKPIILVTHVPYDSLVDKEFRRESYEVRGIYNLWGLGDRYVPDENMISLLENVYADDTPIQAVLAGHLHFAYETNLTDNVAEYVFAPSYSGNIGVINVVPVDE